MPRFDHSVVIRTDKETAFDLTQDYQRRLSWDPFLREAKLVDSASAKLGAHAWCVDRIGLGMETVYVSFQRPDVAAVVMTKGPRIIGKFAASWRFKTEDDRIRVVFTYFVKVNRSISLLEPLIVAVFSREMKIRLKCLKQALELN